MNRFLYIIAQLVPLRACFSGLFTVLAVMVIVLAGPRAFAGEAEQEVVPVKFDIQLDTVMEHDEGDFLWFHPRVAAVPGAGKDGAPLVVMTLQKHLHKSDYYSGTSYMRTADLGKTWEGPFLPPELDWIEVSDTEQISVADVTPGWHAPTGKVIAIGVHLVYRNGQQVYDKPRMRVGAYAVCEPKTDAWTRWRKLETPHDEDTFFVVTPGCTQWIVEPDGSILLPFYFHGAGETLSKSTVARCAFNGETLSYVEHGDELAIDVPRGFGEPSIAKYKGRYFLSIRNDQKGYVTVGDDGLHYAKPVPWTFDDGAELGSYNTQQHWLVHEDGLFLTYTRRGAGNDHIMRHRAPLFIAQVDPQRLCVIRATEKILIPERGATLGNFGAAAISPRESWVTVAEGVWNDDARKRGAKGAVFVARVLWHRPNTLAVPE